MPIYIAPATLPRCPPVPRPLGDVLSSNHHQLFEKQDLLTPGTSTIVFAGLFLFAILLPQISINIMHWFLRKTLENMALVSA